MISKYFGKKSVQYEKKTSELHDFSIRGRLNSLVPLARNVGVLLAYIIGALIKYEDIPFVFILFPISYMILVFFLPNTPQYHLKINDFEASIFHISKNRAKIYGYIIFIGS